MQKRRFNIELSDEAENDFDQLYDYYLTESKNLADRFYTQLNDSFNKICKNPLALTKVFKNLHRYPLLRFPFVIYFQILDNSVKVVAIFHTSRNPLIWNERIK